MIRWIVLGTCAAVLAMAAQDAAPAREQVSRPVIRPVPVAVAAPGRGPAGFLPAEDNDGSVPPPERVRIPAIGVDSPLEQLHLDGTGALTPPRDFAHAGWFADGAVPGEVGPAVIAGHVDSTTGPAVFFALDRLHPGDRVQVERADGWVGFVVTDVRRYPKAQFPTAQVYGPTPDPQLRLITCSGAFDNARRSYVDNTVVYAVLP